ncbi:MAG: type II toxin-antitoxin system RelE/ParE family toxin [Pyrinomonadaceae bacterium]
MRVKLNREVYSDIRSGMEYYVGEAGTKIAADFFDEFRRCRRRISEFPYSFPLVRQDVRRMNFTRFPYHILYQIVDEQFVKILIVKHDSRHPSFGSERT